MHKMNYGAHGYGGFFCSSLLDRLWRPNMPLEEVAHTHRTRV